ncbi:MAG: extracellular solute-binding protein [Chloroflexi bacterium]|nr:extracellular solute-binding protein [Chloroflexota bacterium]
MRRIEIMLVMAAVVLSLLVGACGQGPGGAGGATRPNWEQDWDRTVAEAKKEGTLVIYTIYGANWREAFVQTVAQKYGITVDVITGRGAELRERIINEHTSKVNIADVAVFGTDDFRLLKGKDVLEPLEKVLLLPEVTDPKAWWRGEFPWIDETKTGVYYIESVTPPVIINTDLVKPGEINTWTDLLDPKWKGKILIDDPTVSGGGNTAMTFVANGITGYGATGLDYIKAFVKQEPMLQRDSRLKVEWVARGRAAMAIIGAPDTALQFIKDGALMKQVPFGDRSYVISGAGNVMMLKGAPHPNAARLFVNFLLTKEGTYTSSKATRHQSARADVPTDHMEPAMVRQPGVQYKWRQNDPAYGAKFDELFKQVVESFKPLATGK